MDLSWVPATAGIAVLIVQSAFLVGKIVGKLTEIEKRLDRLENLLNCERKKEVRG